MKIGSKWTTVATRAFMGPVSKNENPVAHGNVCYVHVRRYKGRILRRYVNSNAGQQEEGPACEITEQELADLVE